MLTGSHVWHRAICAMGCARDGDRPDIEWYGATAKHFGRFRDERSSGQCVASLQGRGARSVRVLVPDCRGLEQNFHDVTGGGYG